MNSWSIILLILDFILYLFTYYQLNAWLRHMDHPFRTSCGEFSSFLMWVLLVEKTLPLWKRKKIISEEDQWCMNILVDFYWPETTQYIIEIGNFISTKGSDFSSITRKFAKQISRGHIQNPKYPQVISEYWEWEKMPVWLIWHFLLLNLLKLRTSWILW